MQSPRSLDELVILLADNTTEQISPEDVRDAVVSLYPSRGQLTLSSAVATTFGASNTYTALRGVTARDVSVSDSDVTMPSNGVLKFQKAQTQVLLANATLEVLPAGNNHRFTFTFAKNGTALPELSYTAFFQSLSGNPAGVFLSGLIPIVEGDEISVVVKNTTDTTSITASMLTLSGIGVMV